MVASSDPREYGSPTVAVVAWLLRICPIMFTAIWVSWSYSMCVLMRPLDVGWAAHSVVLSLFSWSYVSATWTPPVPVPDQFRLSAVDKSRLQAVTDPTERARLLDRLVVERELPVRTASWHRDDRICESCGLIKPDRAYHCRLCRRCQLGMSHHCVWLANCIALHNHKAFMLSLFYGMLLQVACSVSMVSPFLSIFKQETMFQSVTEFSVVVLFLLSTVFGCSISIFFLFRLVLILKNQSTIEILKSPIFRNHGETFDLGTVKNLQQVFGKSMFKSLLPIGTRTHDGYDWEVRVLN